MQTVHLFDLRARKQTRTGLSTIRPNAKPTAQCSNRPQQKTRTIDNQADCEHNPLCLAHRASCVMLPYRAPVRAKCACHTTISAALLALQLSPPSWQCTWLSNSGAVNDFTTAHEHCSCNWRAPSPTRTKPISPQNSPHELRTIQ